MEKLDSICGSSLSIEHVFSLLFFFFFLPLLTF